MIERPRRVVLLIDYDNLQICASRDTPGRELQLPPVVQLAQRYGTVILARAYAEWNLSTERLAVYKAGIEPAFAPVLRTESDRSGKSLADTVMVAEGMDMLWTLAPDVVVLATSDKDLIPLVRVAKQRGAFVVVLGSDFTAIPLREMADDHVTYRQLITEPSGRFATEAGPARQPAALPEPARRRSRERVGRDRAPISAPATSAGVTSAPAPARTERPPERTERVEPRVEPRPERETSPTVATPAATGGGVSAAEPVAPLSAGLGADTDSQAGGRRRRRRGSRRRSERLGVTGEPYAGNDMGGSDGDGESDNEEAELEITPTTSIAEVAQASSGTVEATPPIATNGVTAAPSEPAPSTSGEAAAPAVRSRRRRTRVAPEAAGAADEASAIGGVSPSSPAEAPADQPSAGEAPGPIEPLANAESDSTNDESGSAAGDESAPATPRPRARRVTSSARGRSRTSR